MIIDAPVTGGGEFPGTSVAESVRVIAGELGTSPHLPYLPVLPDRGPGADAIGRTAALLSAVTVHFAVTTTPGGWRIAGGDSREMRRARAWLSEDLDSLEEQCEGFDRAIVLPVVGPLTLAASLELMSGHRLVRDHGAVGDLAEAMGEALAVHCAEVRRRLPSAVVVPRLDEGLLAAVLEGGISTPSGLDRYRAVGGQRAGELLAGVVTRSGVADVAVRCAGAAPPIDVMAASGASVLSVDLSALSVRGQGDQFGSLVESGTVWLMGVGGEPVSGPAMSEVTATVDRVTQWWTDLGFDPEALPASIGLLPTAPAVDPVAQFTSLRAVSNRLRNVGEGRDD